MAFGPDGEDEWQELLNLLLNHETQFFRPPPTFAALAGSVLPELLDAGQRQGRNSLALWSAGCSTGQEAYSLAMTVRETVDTRQWQVQILGTDVSPRTLEVARRGRYRSHETRWLAEPYRRKYLRRMDGEREDWHEVKDGVRELVQFGLSNLCDAAGYPLGTHDLILCQNVLIYFTPASRAAVVRRLGERLNVGGYLFLGPLDAVDSPAPGLRPLWLEDTLVYQRVR